MPCFPLSRSRNAATLIELLVALGITAGMAGVMLAMAGNIMTSWRSATGDLSARVQARLALDRIQLDLEQAVFRADGNVWFAVDALRDPDEAYLWEFSAGEAGKPVAESWDLERDRFGWGGMWLRFFTAEDAVRAVSYQIVRRTPTTGGPDSEARYLLYRGAVAARHTFSAGYDILGPEYNPGDPPGGPVHIRHPGEVQRPRRESVLAANVVDLGVRLFWLARGPGGGSAEYVRIFPWSEGQIVRTPPVPGARPVPEAPDANGDWKDEPIVSRLPDALEITLRILTEEGARALAKLETGVTDGEWWDIVEKHSEVFTRRVVPGSAQAGP